ncbi:MAG: phosphodiester glycosidase family protein [Candidatus Gracilibacteria bacterium]|nr:phosphodiester glycosidase family protein [Candidatus Gracilibacteria bacterium]
MIKKGVLFLFVFSIFVQITFANNYIEKTVDGYKFKYIKYDTKSSDYIFKIGANPDYSATNLRELMEANNGISAINGVFFCPASYKECGGKNFTKNERYVEGEKIGNEVSTGDRVVFALDEKKHSFLFQTDKINKLDEDKIYYGFANFPLLLQDGKSKFQEYVDLGLIDGKMKAKMQRNFICNDKTNRFIYTGYVSEISLENLPDVLLSLGCENALNLDAGGSSAFIYNSRYIIGPGRDVMDGVIIERKGLDTAKIIERTKVIQAFIEKKISNKKHEDKLVFLDELIKGLSNIRKKIYEKNSHDIYEKGVKVGYEINVKDINKLQTTYLINYLTKLLYESKERFTVEEKQRIEAENSIKNKEGLLF